MIAVKRETRSLFAFISFEILCGCYVIHLSRSEDINYFLPLGIIFMILSLMLLSVKNWVRILNIIYSSLFMIWYFSIYWDLLIRRGFISEIDDPFLLMGFVIHLPIIIFNFIAIVFLTRKKVKAYFT